MRLWSLHPQYLDVKGLVAVWREGLLAQAVLLGKTRGYRHHPQLWRFQQSGDPIGSLTAYLWAVHAEALRRGYAFDSRKLRRNKGKLRLRVTRAQLQYELRHLKNKLWARDRRAYFKLGKAVNPRPHPLFRIMAGKIELWEKQVR